MAPFLGTVTKTSKILEIIKEIRQSRPALDYVREELWVTFTMSGWVIGMLKKGNVPGGLEKALIT